MQINPNTVVSMSYTLTLNDGRIADMTEDDQPFTFIHGVGQTLPAFDKALNGLKAGQSFNFKLEAEEGYGSHDPNYIKDIPKSIFEGPEIPQDILVEGAVLPMQDQSGNPMDGRIVSIEAEVVKMDFNHPLAGEALNFTGNIISVREASADELDHGHVHGPGGHHH